MNVDPKLLDEFDKMSRECNGEQYKMEIKNFSWTMLCRNLFGLKDK
jgi:hypothetical protein